MQTACRRMLPDGRRLHLNHGPIDLIVEAWGAPEEVAASYRQAVVRFETVLTELVGELTMLRKPVVQGSCPLRGSIARRMWHATARHLPVFVTPMAAVAGAVAEEVLAAMTEGRGLQRAYVNNGGDIALHLAPDAVSRSIERDSPLPPARPRESGDPESSPMAQWIPACAGTSGRTDRISLRCNESFRLGVVVDPGDPRMPGAFEVSHDMPVRGVATSGRHGRSFSLGIADSVTVLAATADAADAAATLIGNAVDLPGHPAVRRVPACTLDPDSDLGSRLVTVDVGPLGEADIAAALAAGVGAAEDMIEDELLHAAVLVLGQTVRLVGYPGAYRAVPQISRENRIDA